MDAVALSVVIPVYNSGPWLGELVDRVHAALAEAAPTHEVILVNDASPDPDTWPAIEALAPSRPWLRAADLLFNTGQFRATLCGLELARGELVATMDDDLQHPPEELPKLVRAIREDPRVECVMGKYESKRHGWFRNLGSRLVAGIMARLYGKPAGLATTSYRVMTRDLARRLVIYRAAHPQLGPLLVRLTHRIVNVPVEHHPRARGSSGYGLWRLVGETARSIVNASIAPLRFVSLIGFVAAAGAFSVTLWFLARKLLGGIGVAGFTSLILTTTFFSGMILVGIGVLGEYVGRLIGELTGLPRFAIRSTIGGDHDPSDSPR